jgi:adenylate kinase
MKLQYAFGGNPRRKSKGKKRRKKALAKRRKHKHPRAVKSKFLKFGGNVKKRHGRRRKARRNPAGARIYKDKKYRGQEKAPYNKKEAAAANARASYLLSKYKSLPLGSERKAVMNELVSLRNKLGATSAFRKTIDRYKEAGYTVKEYDLKESDVAKTKKGRGKKGKGRKKGGKKGKRSAAQKRALKKMLAAAKAARKAKGKGRKKGKGKKAGRKGRKGKRSAAQKRALKKMLAAAKRARKASKKSGRKGRKKSSRRKKHHYPKMYTHKHSRSMRHIKKGSSFKFKTVAKKGKRKITVSGRVKFNPFGETL